MFSVMAELEKDMIAERMLGGKISKARKGIPVSGAKPIGRKFKKKKKKWKLDEQIAKALRWAASEYLNGGSLRDIAYEMKSRCGHPLSYDSLRRNLKNNCGNEWSVNFKGETLTFKVPRILPDDIIKQIHDRLAFNKFNNRKDVNKYVLSGFIFCEKCYRALVGQTTTDGKYVYYRHSNRIDDKKCIPRPFNQVSGKKIEDAVFLTIFENTVDVPSFEAAIADSLPDQKTINKLEAEITQDKKALKRFNQDLYKLAEAVMKGTLKKETIKKNETDLIKQKDILQETLKGKERRLKVMPSIELLKEEAEEFRKLFLKQYSGD